VVAKLEAQMMVIEDDLMIVMKRIDMVEPKSRAGKPVQQIIIEQKNP